MDARVPDGVATRQGWQLASEATTDPTTNDLTSLNRVAIYMKNDKFVVAYNNAGTITYIKIAMDGSATTIVHNTSAP